MFQFAFRKSYTEGKFKKPLYAHVYTFLFNLWLETQDGKKTEIRHARNLQ